MSSDSSSKSSKKKQNKRKHSELSQNSADKKDQQQDEGDIIFKQKLLEKQFQTMNLDLEEYDSQSQFKILKTIQSEEKEEKSKKNQQKQLQKSILGPSQQDLEKPKFTVRSIKKYEDQKLKQQILYTQLFKQQQKPNKNNNINNTEDQQQNQDQQLFKQNPQQISKEDKRKRRLSTKEEMDSVMAQLEQELTINKAKKLKTQDQSTYKNYTSKNYHQKDQKQQEILTRKYNNILKYIEDNKSDTSEHSSQDIGSSQIDQSTDEEELDDIQENNSNKNDINFNTSNIQIEADFSKIHIDFAELFLKQKKHINVVLNPNSDLSSLMLKRYKNTYNPFMDEQHQKKDPQKMQLIEYTYDNFLKQSYLKAFCSKLKFISNYHSYTPDYDMEQEIEEEEKLNFNLQYNNNNNIQYNKKNNPFHYNNNNHNSEQIEIENNNNNNYINDLDTFGYSKQPVLDPKLVSFYLQTQQIPQKFASNNKNSQQYQYNNDIIFNNNSSNGNSRKNSDLFDLNQETTNIFEQEITQNLQPLPNQQKNNIFQIYNT